MERLRTGALARALEKNRAAHNALFAAARARGAAPAPEAWAAFLCGPVDRLARVVEAHDAARAEEVADALARVGLDLVAGGVVGDGGRCPEASRAWDDLLPRVVPQLLEAPRLVAARLLNAVAQLSREESPGVAGRWTKALGDLAPRCRDADALLRTGLVLAWRCGLAHYRESALERWRTLPDDLRRAALGLAPDGDSPSLDEIARGLDDPWYDPSSAGGRDALRLAFRVGGFRGFGGAFVRPPLVARAAGGIVASDGDETYSLHADAWGATLRRAGDPGPIDDGDAAGVRVTDGGAVSVGGRTTRLPELAGAASHAAVDTTLAVACAHSHFVYVVALPRGR